MPKNYSKSKLKFIFTVLQIILFVIIIVYADELSKGNEKIYINQPLFVQIDDGSSDSISLDSIAIVELNEQDQGIIQYVVQPGDNLSKIASTFGITVSHIKKINNIGSRPIRPGDKLVVTDNEEGIIYSLTDKSNVLVFANKYNFNLEDFMALNSIPDETEILQQGQELFLPISYEKAYEIGLLERPAPEPKPIKKYVPVINKPLANSTKKPTTSSTSTSTASATTSNGSTSKKILSKYVFNKKINNRFAPGNCTWYVATQMPKIFPYTDENNQDRPFGGNAKERYGNASAAGLSVGKSPRAGSIVVYNQLRSAAGHVGIVRSYDASNGDMIIEDMNYAGKYIVTKRTDNSSNSKIIGYIYP
ncbi:LysM peptidoglycan-binding domain-containing protein [Candidatus Gracilibacteria bacterium]|nr:LysM peptidoglycan-binding domain-containing protein [Candidatus Gracilibacteria bacterium]